MAQWDITTSISLYQFDETGYNEDPKVSSLIDENHFIYFYTTKISELTRSILQVLEFDTSTFEITTSGDVFNLDTSIYTFPKKIKLIDENHFLISFIGNEGGYRGRLQVLEFNTSTFEISTSNNYLTFATTMVNVSNFKKIDDNHYIIFYSDLSNYGYSQVFEINTSTFEITTSSSVFNTDTQVSFYESIFDIDSNHVINVWLGSSTYDGIAQTFTINTSTWAITTASDRFVFDTATPQDFSLSEIDTNHFVLFYKGTDNDGYVQVFTVNTSTYAITTSSNYLEYQTSNNSNNACIKVDTNHFLNFYQGDNYDGVAQVFEVNTSTFSITTTNGLLTFESEKCYENCCIKIDTNHFLNVWKGGVELTPPNVFGRSQIFEINLQNTLTQTFNTKSNLQSSQTKTITTKASIAKWITVQVSANNDDGYQIIGGVQTLNSDVYCGVNTDQITTYNGGVRFQNVTIPNGSIILSAILYGYLRGSGGNTAASVCKLKIRSEIDNNLGDFSGTEINSRTRSNSGIDWDNRVDVGTGWHNTGDVKTLIQEVLDRTSFASGNSMVLFLDNDETDTSGDEYAYIRWWDYDSTPAQSLKLEILYQPLTGQVVNKINAKSRIIIIPTVTVKANIIISNSIVDLSSSLYLEVPFGSIVRQSNGTLNLVTNRYVDSIWRIYNWISTDNGLTWSADDINSDATAHQYAPKILLDENDGLHAIWEGIGYGTYTDKKQILYSYKEFSGTWTEPELICEKDNHQYVPSAVIDKNGVIHVVWYGEGWDVATTPYQIIYCYGNIGNWSTPRKITNSSLSQYNPILNIDSKDNLHLVWHGNYNATTQNEIQYKRKFRGYWTPTEVISRTRYGNATEVYPSTVIDKYDNLHVVWSGNAWGTNLNYNNIIYRKRSVLTGTWSAVEQITDIGGTQNNPVISIDKNDDLYVIWEGRGYGTYNPVDGENYDIVAVKKPIGGSWSSVKQITDNPNNQKTPGLFGSYRNTKIKNIETNIPNSGTLAFWLSYAGQGRSYVIRTSNLYDLDFVSNRINFVTSKASISSVVKTQSIESKSTIKNNIYRPEYQMADAFDYENVAYVSSSYATSVNTRQGHRTADETYGDCTTGYMFACINVPKNSTINSAYFNA